MENKYNLKEILEQKYDSCKSSLKQTSLDDRNQIVKYYLCDDEQLDIFDFDNIKNIVNKTSKSPDAIYIRDKDFYIVEFKNQNPCDINCKDLQEKFTFAIDFFRSTVNNIKDYNFIICLVYKNQGEHKNTQRYKQGIGKKACCTIDDINKNKYNNFYKSIITKDVNFYKNNFEELKC
ncbi:MAG: hypothetical protein LGB71_05655 [Sulfurovum sp.]|nr:hypothetical protein [Sulfurovum sp.]